MKSRIVGSAFAAALIIFAGYAALYIAPEEATMHEVQRIFYFHVSAWVATFTAFTIVFISNIAYLTTRGQRWDSLGVSAAEVGIACCSIGLITGPLWAKPVWGIWWTWDARLTTTFIMWLMYISYLMLRSLLEDPRHRASLSAVFGIFAFLDVPLVYMSNRLWRTQHPQPVFFGGPNSGIDPTMLKVFLLCMAAVLIVMIPVLVDRYRVECMRNEVEELRQEIELHSLDAQSQSRPVKEAL
ncbi:MAG TPA: cytochrome c biogenesis protein [Candidatus Dormibacteraeota bacterium]|nr:cytochrome c biogenesis protein [Candidatus Dormibacteraeota bacterium]